MKSKSRLFYILFALALIMGAGPGVYLINPRPDATEAPTFLGMPAVYAWAVTWFLVQASLVLWASQTIWKSDDEKEGDE